MLSDRGGPKFHVTCEVHRDGIRDPDRFVLAPVEPKMARFRQSIPEH